MASFKISDDEYYRQIPTWFADATPDGEEGEQMAMFFLSDPEEEAWAAPAAVIFEMPPNYVLLRHAHPSYRFEVVIKGELTTEDGTVLGPGDVMVAGPGELYGPKVAGPEGCTTAEVFARADAIVRLIADSSEGVREHDVRKGEFPRDFAPIGPRAARG
jgi:hypothetical protein